MPFFEKRYCTLSEYEAGIPERVTEENVAIDGIYSLMMRLSPRKPYDAAIFPVLIQDIKPTNESRRRPVDLSFIRGDRSVMLDAQPEMQNGHLTAFGSSVFFNDSKTMIQRVETGYLKERLDVDWMDDDLYAMLDTAIDLHQMNGPSRELQPIQ